MENHPIPQDVTGFKFKLIGSVTVKQFLYILGGGILAVVFFMLPISAFIRIPLSFLFGAVGTALAFVPIEGRPMDVMMKNFLKALPSENQYIFRKKGAEALISEYFTAQAVSVQKAQEVDQSKTQLDAKRALLYKTLKQSYRPDNKEQEVLTNINNYLHEETPHSISPPVQNVDVAPVEEAPTQPQPTTTTLTMSVSDALKVVSPPAETPIETPIQKPSPQVKAAEQIAPTPVQPAAKPAEKEVKPQEPPSPHVTQTPIEAIPAEPAPLNVSPTTPSQAQTVAPGQSANVNEVVPEASLNAGFPELPDTPNIVMGIIKDPRGKIIPNILVEIMDTQGIPVRAFKTNALGQFAAATPLPNGEYNVILEDPRKQNEFENISIKLDGTIFNPLEIISTDQREKLRRELFGGQTAKPAAAA